MSEQTSEYRAGRDADDFRQRRRARVGDGSRARRGLRTASSYDGLRAVYPVGRKRRRAVAGWAQDSDDPVKARATYFVPAGGIESAHNMGDTRFFEALFDSSSRRNRAAKRSASSDVRRSRAKRRSPARSRFSTTRASAFPKPRSRRADKLVCVDGRMTRRCTSPKADR